MYFTCIHVQLLIYNYIAICLLSLSIAISTIIIIMIGTVLHGASQSQSNLLNAMQIMHALMKVTMIG